ncbi:inosine triphosphate pyrophosphatase-like protein [Powellomyces hirtus]|nr:inosine triphosphate pyrophosphatase-like protein [Powellomyces hirtus]
MSSHPPLILGSSSKYRAHLLTAASIPFTILTFPIDEKNNIPGRTATSTPSETALAVARAKAAALLANRAEDVRNALVVTCDQVVSCGGEMREKPKDEAECRRYLKGYESQPAETHSAVVVTNTSTGAVAEGVDVARQHFLPLPAHIIDALIAKRDVMYCAGGFMIDDPIMFPYLGAREGDEDSIIGMPLVLLKRLIEQVSN